MTHEQIKRTVFDVIRGQVRSEPKGILFTNGFFGTDIKHVYVRTNTDTTHIVRIANGNATLIR